MKYIRTIGLFMALSWDDEFVWLTAPKDSTERIKFGKVEDNMGPVSMTFVLGKPITREEFEATLPTENLGEYEEMFVKNYHHLRGMEDELEAGVKKITESDDPMAALIAWLDEAKAADGIDKKHSEEELNEMLEKLGIGKPNDEEPKAE
jgi:hypothetical protein